MSAVEIQVLRVDGLQIPKEQTSGAACFDIHVTEDFTIKADRIVSKAFIPASEPKVVISNANKRLELNVDGAPHVYSYLVDRRAESDYTLTTQEILQEYYEKYFKGRVLVNAESFGDAAITVTREFGEFITCTPHHPSFSHYEIEKYPVIAATALHVAIPEGYALEILDRSGYGFNDSISLHNGTIDSDYRGEVKIKAYNLGNKDVVIKAGDRLAQGKLYRTEQATFTLTDSLPETDRGDKGFQSTGR